MSVHQHIFWLSEQIAALTDQIEAAREYGPTWRKLTKQRAQLIAQRKDIFTRTARAA